MPSEPSDRVAGDLGHQITSPADLLALGIGPADAGAEFESEVDLGAFLCACPDLQLHGCLGRGGMGVVYRARQVRLDRDVAVKLMSPALARDAEFAQRFEREAKALARLDHPGIVAVHDFGQAAGVYYLVMELVDGPNLREVMQQGVEADQAAEIVGQLCDALAYAHERGVVHRDVKPENVLLDRRGRVRVADFGLAKMHRDDANSAMRTRHVMGTPQYMAPEQVRDPGSVDHRTDIFAIGVVFYEMLTGQLPVGRFPAPSQLGKGDAGLDEIVLRALEFNREHRFQAASEIRVALSSHRDAVDRPTVATPTGRNSGRWWLAGGGIAAAATAAAVLTLDLGGAATPEASPSQVVIIDDPAPAAARPIRDVAGRDRWPARALATLDPDIAAVVGADWTEIRQAPLVAQLGDAAFDASSASAQRCKHDVVDRTHKVLVGLGADGTPRELVIHGEWTPEELESCLGAVAEDAAKGSVRWSRSTLGPHTRFELTGASKHTLTVGRQGSTIVASLDPAVTSAQIDAKLGGALTSVALRDRVAAAVDLAAPVWAFAEPTAGLLPLGMTSVGGMIELWDKVGVDATASFADDAAAAKAKTLVESYATVIASLPDVELAPRLEIRQLGPSLHLTAEFEIPAEMIRAQIGAQAGGGATVTLVTEDAELVARPNADPDSQ